MKRFNSMVNSIALLAIISLFSGIAAAQGTENSILVPTRHFIKSELNSKTYELNVSLPKKYSEKDTLRYPVLFVLDGKFSFNSMNSIREVLDLGREIKDIIIVSIDAKCNTDADWLASRHNDFTPSAIPSADTLWSKIMNIPMGKLKSGGADKFLSVLENELIPYIDTRYKTTGDRGISGHSLGGLFVGYCLLKKADLFKRYGINSPSFWWNNNEMMKIEEYYASKQTKLAANVFFSIGSSEDAMMYATFNSFVNSLKNHNYKDLNMTVKIFDGETHLSVVPAGSSRTLRVLYGSNVK